MSFVVQMGLNENEKQIPKHSWQSKKGGNQTYARYSKKYNTQKAPKAKHGPAKPKAERKSRKNNNNNNNNNQYNSLIMPCGSGGGSTLAMYNPASYFQYSNPASVYASDVSLVRHKAKLVGTSPPPRGKKERKEDAAGTYQRPKFDKMIEPIVRNSRLDHSYFKGASDPLPVPAPLPSPYKNPAPLSNSVNGLSKGAGHHPPHLHPPAKRPLTPPKSPVHTTPLLPIFNQLPASKSVFGIARAVSPPTKASPLHQSQSTSYLVPQHPLIPPMSPHHLLSLNPRLPNSLKSKEPHHHQGRHSESSCDEERDPDPQGEETETAPENDAEEDEQDRRRRGVQSGRKEASVAKETTTKSVAPAEAPKDSASSGGAVDDSVTRCVCGFLHDDGYMICCDTCQVWQHVDCMEIDRQNIPDEYLCEECSPRRVDKMKAIGIQIQKIKRLTDKTVRDNDDDANSDSSHSSQERPRQRGGARKGKAASKTPKPRGKRGANAAAAGGGATAVRRRKSAAANLSPLTPPAVRKKMGAGLGTPVTPQPAGPPPHMNNILHSNNKRKMITVAEKKQNHSSKANASGSGSGKVLSPLNHHKVGSGVGSEKKNHTGVKRMGKKQQEKKLLNNNHKRKNTSLLGGLSSSLEPPVKKEKESPPGGSSLLSTTPSKPAPSAPPAEEPGTSSDEEDSKPMTRWIDNYEEATCNYYAPDLRARIATIKLNGSHQDTGVKLPASLLSTTVQKCRASLLSSGTKILVTSTNMSGNQALIEMRGKYLLATGDRKNVPSPGQHVFFYAMIHEAIDIVIDCKTYGNDARFVRRSCKPNAVMKHCIDKGSIHIYLTALYSIPKNSEVTVAFSSGGNPDQCTCGDKVTCTAAAQKTKLYTERKHQATNQVAEIPEAPPTPKVELKPTVQPVPSPPPSLPPPTTTESEEEKKVEVKSEEVEEKEEKPKLAPPVVSPAPIAAPPVTPAKKEKESKPAVNTPSEKAKKPSVEEKRKSVSESESTSNSSPADTSTTDSNSAVKKEQESEKKPVVTPAGSKPKRKKSVAKRKYSESSQSLESEGNNSEDEEEDEATSKVSTRRSSTSVTTKSTPGKKEVTTPTKLSREERKLEAIMKAFERMEKSATRQKESRVRKDSTSAPEKPEEAVVSKNKVQAPPVAKATKRIVRKRKGRSKSFSISSGTRSRRMTRATEAAQNKDEDSSSGDEDDDMSSDTSQPKNSVQTPPPSFKLPFSKKTPDDGNQDPESPEKPAGGCAKKRWLRQAISEECESPRSDSPTLLGAEQAGPLKKRRLARASLSSEEKNCTPPTTPVPDEDTSTPPHDSAPHPPLTPKTAYACLTPTSNEPAVPAVATSTETALTTVTTPAEQPTASNSDVDSAPAITSEVDNKRSPPKSGTKPSEAPSTPRPDVDKPSAPSTTVETSIPAAAATDVPLPSPSTDLPRKELPPSSLPPPRRFEPPNTLDITIPLLLPPPRSCLPVSNLLLPSPQALESSLQNSTDFSMPSTLPPVPATPPTNFYMSPWSPGGAPGTPSSVVATSLPPESFTPPPPAPPVKEKLVTKRKLSISEYRQRKGVASLATTPTTTPLLDDPNERRGDSSCKGAEPGCSPPTSSSSDEEGEGEGRHSSVSVGATRVIEKSVLVDNLIAKISKSADSLAENKEFKDPQFTRIPKAPCVLNNNQQTKKGAKPDSFLERPKENLLERLNREFNIRLSDGPPIGLPKPTPPLPPGVMPSPVVAPPPIYEDLTSDLYIPIASRSHTPRSLKK